MCKSKPYRSFGVFPVSEWVAKGNQNRPLLLQLEGGFETPDQL
jgi:hypothetical protein